MVWNGSCILFVGGPLGSPTVTTPFTRQTGCHFVFRVNNAFAHQSLLVSAYLLQQNITTLPWPYRIPDIETHRTTSLRTSTLSNYLGRIAQNRT